MSKEALAQATNSSDLEFEQGVVRDIDKVVAMAGGNTLGGLVFRVRECGQPEFGRQAVLILAHRIVRKFSLGRAVAERTAACALAEFVNPHCGVCNGAREVMLGQVKVTCPACEGSGKQRHSNNTRRAVIGTYGSRIDAAVAECHKDLANALTAFLARTGYRLGEDRG